MNITEIKERFELLEAATLEKSILVKDLAKELKVSVTDLMKFILDNPGMFATEESWSYKSKTVCKTLFGVKSMETIKVKDKLRGLGITNVYLSPEDNYRTEEWLQKQKETYAKTIWISKWDNYGRIEGEFVKADDDIGSYMRKHLWRNTAEKVNDLAALGVFGTAVFHCGSFWDCGATTCETAINKEGRKKAMEAGWTLLEDD